MTPPHRRERRDFRASRQASGPAATSIARLRVRSTAAYDCSLLEMLAQVHSSQRPIGHQAR